MIGLFRGVGIAAAALCAGIAGAACVIYAGIAVGMPVFLVGNLALDRMYGCRASPSDAIGYLLEGVQGPLLDRVREGANRVPALANCLRAVS